MWVHSKNSPKLDLMINRNWILLMSQDTTTTQEFCVFLHILRMLIVKKFCWGGCRVMIILKYASIHQTPQARSIARSYNMEIIYLLPYCSYLALVEFVFWTIKGHIKHLLTD